jgi:flagellum-specific peptidoglycan hydrolase FlgJ
MINISNKYYIEGTNGMNAFHVAWIKSTAEAASAASHIFPVMAACEAALESAFGESTLAKEGNNLFGMKQHIHLAQGDPALNYGTLSLPTKEFLDGNWRAVQADWVRYPSIAECFADRMRTLKRLAGAYSHYARALTAPSAGVYVEQVSKSWSTDPQRAEKVIAIYREFVADSSLTGTKNPETSGSTPS